MFSIHYAFRLLKKDSDNIDLKISKQVERDYNVLNCKSLLTKIKLIKKVEAILEVDTLNIDTKWDIDKLNNFYRRRHIKKISYSLYVNRKKKN